MGSSCRNDKHGLPTRRCKFPIRPRYRTLELIFAPSPAPHIKRGRRERPQRCFAAYSRLSCTPHLHARMPRCFLLRPRSTVPDADSRPRSCRSGSSKLGYKLLEHPSAVGFFLVADRFPSRPRTHSYLHNSTSLLSLLASYSFRFLFITFFRSKFTPCPTRPGNQARRRFQGPLSPARKPAETPRKNTPDPPRVVTQTTQTPITRRSQPRRPRRHQTKTLGD